MGDCGDTRALTKSDKGKIKDGLDRDAHLLSVHSKHGAGPNAHPLSTPPSLHLPCSMIHIPSSVFRIPSELDRGPESEGQKPITIRRMANRHHAPPETQGTGQGSEAGNTRLDGKEGGKEVLVGTEGTLRLAPL